MTKYLLIMFIACSCARTPMQSAIDTNLESNPDMEFMILRRSDFKRCVGNQPKYNRARYMYVSRKKFYRRKSRRSRKAHRSYKRTGKW